MKLFNILFWLYLLLLPLMRLAKLFPFFEKVQYADIIFIFLFLLWFLHIFRSKNVLLPSKKIIILLALVIATNFLSCLHSRSFSKSILDYLGLLYLICVFLVFSSAFKEKRLFSAGTFIIFLTSLITSIIGISSLILYTIGKYSWVKSFLFFTPVKDSVAPFPRIRSTFLTPEMFIMFSQLGMVCGMISSELRNNLKVKRFFYVGILIIILTVIFSYSRSLTGFFMALSIIILNKKNIHFPRLSRILIIFIFAILLISTIISSVWILYPVILSKDISAESLTVSFHTAPDIRALLRDAAFKIALQHPFFGIGQGMFTYEAKDYIDLNAAKNTLKISGFQFPFNIDPHSAYFGSIAEIGFVGLALMLAFFSFIIVESIRSVKQTQHVTFKNIRIFLLASFLGYLLTGLVADIFSIRQFWINIALIIGASNIKTQNE